MALPNAFVSADCLFRVDFLCGSGGVGGVPFLFWRFGEGAISSEDVVEWLSSEWLDEFSSVVVVVVVVVVAVVVVVVVVVSF